MLIGRIGGRKVIDTRRLCLTNGDDIGPVDVFGFMLQTRLDAAYQCLDMGTVEVIVEVDPSHEPYLARTEEGDRTRKLAIGAD